MSVSPRKTRTATGALRNRTTPAPAARAAKKGRVVSSSKAKSNIPTAQPLHNLLTEALAMAKSLDVTPDNRVTLRNVRKIAVALLDILPGDERTVRDLEYESHYLSLTSLASELAASETNDPEDRCYEQIPLMEGIMEEVVEWLPDIWLEMAEENADMDLIRRCLNLCSAAADDLRGEFLDCTNRLVIANSEKKTIYDQSYYVVDYMAWMWRESLIFSAIQGLPVPPEVMKDDEIHEQIFSLFCQDTTDPRNEDGYAFWDNHWSPEMKAADCLYAKRHNHWIAEFIKLPSFPLYTSLVSQYPDIKPCILSTIKKGLFSDKPFIRYSDAAEILVAASQTEDIVRLVDYLSGKGFTLHTPAILIIVKYLSKVTDKKLRTRALQAVEKGLETSKQDALDAVNGLYPGLKVAQLWLRRLRDSGQFPFDDDIHHDRYYEREANLRRFAECAVSGGPLADLDWVPPVKNRREVYSEDNNYEDEPQTSEPDLAQSIQDWAQILGKWPDEMAAAEVWNRIKFDGSELPFSAVEGAEEVLIDRIEHADSVQWENWRQANPLPPPPSKWQHRLRPRFWSFPVCESYDFSKAPSSVYLYVTDGLQALKIFSCQDHRSLRR
ncbi:uncharacterized protein EV420DRAFT_799781 [Desarmillaria tabescens]|uniref:Uncharacterized protein n=1 Tax=Armillaria tabescens TaxID=1929756 RepID=A0AA39NI60_ARMTA|nr:uncharacterized protein EV420DRAFT_799781 [Desarmillaria tabescens]KAK0465893.1 hypothetical protein EV420DRAFT_799781 [Desarmillaria tabescens]